MAEQKEPINVAIFEYRQGNTVLKAKGVSYTTIDDAIWELIHGLDHLQKEKGLVFDVLRIYSEWQPSEQLCTILYSKYPTAQLTYSFQEGDEDKFKQTIQGIKENAIQGTTITTNVPNKKWWQIWK